MYVIPKCNKVQSNFKSIAYYLFNMFTTYHICDTVVRFESPASHMCDIVDYLYMCIS